MSSFREVLNGVRKEVVRMDDFTNDDKHIEPKVVVLGHTGALPPPLPARIPAPAMQRLTSHIVLALRSGKDVDDPSLHQRLL